MFKTDIFRPVLLVFSFIDILTSETPGNNSNFNFYRDERCKFQEYDESVIVHQINMSAMHVHSAVCFSS